MQHFTYHRRSELHRNVGTLVAVMLFDIPVVVGLAILLPSPWRYVVTPLGLCVLALGYVRITKVLRTRHRVDDASLDLALGTFRTTIPRSQIRQVALYSGPVPSLGFTGTVTYISEADTL